ncbi:MAG: type II secretion system F family protein [Acidimicrobiales bacterium]
MSVLLALAAAYGAFLLWTGLALHWQGLGPGPRPPDARPRARPWRRWLAQAGLHDVRPAEFAAVVAVLALAGGGLAFALFGGVVPALATAGLAATAPVTSYQARRRRRRATARAAWPRMIEEMRVHTSSLGRSIPQALFETGRRGPAELRPAFAAAEREWLVSTDFARTVAVLKEHLDDPTADTACETLLVAHEVGGTDLDRRLAALAEDRAQDLEGRRDAEAKQAGVRFARRFVLVVPIGMALAGLSIGTGRAAYETPMGQVAVLIGLLSMAGCWLWAGRLMRLPDTERVFHD